MCCLEDIFAASYFEKYIEKLKKLEYYHVFLIDCQ